MKPKLLFPQSVLLAGIITKSGVSGQVQSECTVWVRLQVQGGANAALGGQSRSAPRCDIVFC